MDGRSNRRNKAPFRDGLVWTVDLTVEIKLRFRDGLVWTVGLTVEIVRYEITFMDLNDKTIVSLGNYVRNSKG